MLLIIVGIFIIVFVFKLSDSKKSGEGILLALILSLICIELGVILPSNGFYEPELVETHELLPFTEIVPPCDEEREVYVIDTINLEEHSVYVKNTDKTENNRIEKYDENVDIISSDECTVKKYKSRAKISFISFGFFASKDSYEICVPEENVLRITY